VTEGLASRAAVTMSWQDRALTQSSSDDSAWTFGQPTTKWQLRFMFISTRVDGSAGSISSAFPQVR
jgi:hypothetical protein